MAKAGTPSKLVERSSPRSAETRGQLVSAAVETLKTEGYAGASARSIAERAGVNQGLIFYHFGSVANLLLAALDAVSAQRLNRYETAVEGASSPTELVDAATAIFREDLDAGYVTVLVEMIAGASSTPGLGTEVSARIGPWIDFARRAIEHTLGGTPLDSILPSADVAYAVVALYLGLEMLSHLTDDPAPALALFSHAGRLVQLLSAASGPLPREAP
jgi:AcrR family transcriptional regulator